MFADHVKPDPVWFELEPGDRDEKAVVIVPDASTEELESLVRKMYCPGEDIFFTFYDSQNLISKSSFVVKVGRNLLSDVFTNSLG